MKISLNWIGDFVDLSDQTPEMVADLLSLHTAEVEGIEVQGEAISDVVVGEVLTCEQHPDADKLSVTTVAFGQDEPAQVVCGASNVRAGLKIAFAPLKACLPGDFKIKKAKLRGVVSCGMICSARELELSEEHDGILELDSKAQVGVPLVEHLGLQDFVLELDNKSLTHRPDLWGHYGFARELAAILKRELKPLPVLSAWPAGQSDFKIDIQDESGCPAYWGLELELSEPPKPSPEWLQRRLQAVDQRPVNDLVDLTNYVLLELGQPTHAFDSSKLSSQTIVVRRAKDSERLVTLDEIARDLLPQDVVIADSDQAVALAGVMGGADAEVGDSTTKVLLESAVFNPVLVRRTSQRLALRSEASSRFEKSLDPALAEQALFRFSYLLGELRPDARILGCPASAGVAKAPDYSLPLSPDKTNQILGLDLDSAQIKAHLTSLGFTVEEQGEMFQVEVPSWRATKDVTTSIDLVEEVGRLEGYDKVTPEPLVAPVIPPLRDESARLVSRLTHRLAGAHHAFESQSYSFLDHAWAKRLGLSLSDFVCLHNPIADGMNLMRRDPVASLLEQALNNIGERPSGRLFEFAKGYEPNAEQAEPTERSWLGMVAWQPSSKADSNMRSLKTVAEDILKLSGMPVVPAHLEAPPAWCHPREQMGYLSAQRPGSEPCVWVAKLHTELALELGFEGIDVAVLLIDQNALLQGTDKRRFSFTSPPKLPAIKVDVALALPKSVPYAEVDKALRKAGGKLLEALELFDVFEGGALPSDQRSMAFHAVLRSSERTLSDKDEQKFLKSAVRIAEQLGGSLRG